MLLSRGLGVALPGSIAYWFSLVLAGKRSSSSVVSRPLFEAAKLRLVSLFVGEYPYGEIFGDWIVCLLGGVDQFAVRPDSVLLGVEYALDDGEYVS